MAHTKTAITPWMVPRYDLDALKVRAKRMLVLAGDDPGDSLKVYRMVARLRGEELRALSGLSSPPGTHTERPRRDVAGVPARQLPRVPEARSAREETL